MSQPGERRRRREADRAESSGVPMVPDTPSRRTRREPPSAPASDAPPARYGYRQRSSAADDRRVPSWTQEQPPAAPPERPGRRAETSSPGRSTGPVPPQHTSPVASRGTGPVGGRTTGPVPPRTTGQLPPAGPPTRVTGPVPPPTGPVRPTPSASGPAPHSTRGMAPIQDPRPRGTESVWSGGSLSDATSQLTRPLGTGSLGQAPPGTGATQTSAAGWRPSAVTPLSAPLPSTVPPARPQPRPGPVVDEPDLKPYGSAEDRPVTGALPWESIAPDVQDVPEKPGKKAKSDKADTTRTPTAKKKGLWSYTLLHVLVLAVVAFVLGVIIWMLLNKNGSALEAEGALSGPQTTATGAVAVR
ncbi:MAG: hypothetical protein FWH11_02380 [Micrococcales bacterium]|nr:hypothetical protein [Micrococcales bacterium]